MRRGVAVLAGAAFVALLVALSVWPPINDVSTGATPEYPDIQPRAYRFSSPRVLAAAVESIDALERLERVEVDEERGVVLATATTRSGRFTDDVEIRVEPNGEGGALVFVRSRSRVGRADFGQNARTIRRIQQAMDDNLGVD